MTKYLHVGLVYGGTKGHIVGFEMEPKDIVPFGNSGLPLAHSLGELRRLQTACVSR